MCKTQIAKEYESNTFNNIHVLILYKLFRIKHLICNYFFFNQYNTFALTLSLQTNGSAQYRESNELFRLSPMTK